MLGSIFELRNAINEGAFGGFSGDNVGYQFLGDEEECFNEAALAISENVANLMEYNLECDRLLVENFSDNSKFEPLLEASIQGAWEKIKQFFDKLKKVFIGILDRVKAFFFKMTSKTDKWLQVMKPRIDAAGSRSGIEDIEVEVYEKCESSFTNKFTTVSNALDSEFTDIERKSGDDSVTIGVDKSELSSVENDRESYVENKLKAACDNKSPEDYLSDFKDTISETTTKSVSDVKNTLIDYIKTYKKTQDNIKTTISKLIQKLNKLETKFTQLSRKVNKNDYTHVVDGDGGAGNFGREPIDKKDRDKTKKSFISYLEAKSQICGKLSSLISQLQSAYLSQMKKVLNTYMNALTKYAYYKAPKTA